jgi:hypothetical protein
MRRSTHPWLINTRRFRLRGVGLAFALAALWSQLLLAALPLAAGEAGRDPILGALVICHADAGASSDPAHPGQAPVSHAAQCPLCLALHQLAGFAPMVPPVVIRSETAEAVAYSVSVPAVIGNAVPGLRNARAPPYPV